MKKLLVYSILSLLLFVFLQLTCSVDFLYAEQFRLFRFSADYAQPLLSQAGGPSSLVASFLMQFFSQPYLGALIVSAFFFLIALGTDLLLSRLCPSVNLSAFGIILGLMQAGLATETFYSYTLTVALILTVWFLVALCSINKFRFVATLMLLPLLYYLAGILALIAALVVIVISSAVKDWYTLTASLCATSLVIIANAVLSSQDLSHTWTLDTYYFSFLSAPQHSYWMIGLLFVAVLVALALKKCSFPKYDRYVLSANILLGIVLGGWYFFLCHGLHTTKVKQLEVMRWNGQWNEILAMHLPTDRIPLYANYQNIALAAQGKLADELMNYGQCGTLGLQQVWQGLQQESDLLSDVFMQQGHVAMAQKMAFTAMQGNEEMMHGRLMLRLIETNLILKNEKVAEKYIRILEQTLYYADKARSYRKYLGHPELVASDPVLGPLQKCTLGCDWCPNDLEQGLEQIVKANPSYKNAFHYLGAFYLLQNNLDGFRSFMDRYYDCPGMNPLPVAFQVAADHIIWRQPSNTESE